MRRLVARADAVMHNMRGDAAARLGVDYQSARELNPAIVYLYAGSYGSTGPGAGRAAFHPMMGALSGGALRQLGRGNEPPAADVPLDADARYEYSLRMIRSNEASPDITGALGVATALSLGLLHRQRTGHGQYIETTMLASNLLLCSDDAIRYPGKPDLPEVDSGQRGTGALNRLYQTADGWLFLCTPTEPEWQQLCTAVGRAEWLEDPRYRTAGSRRRFNDQLVAELATALHAQSAAEWEQVFARAGIAGVRADASTGDDFFLSDPQSVGNGFVITGSYPEVNRYRRAGTASVLSRTPGVAKVAHLLGQDGPGILTELGFDEPAIQGMIDGGVLVSTAIPAGRGAVTEDLSMGEATWLGPVELDLETLRSFVTVSEEESLARAAPLLFVSTSGLSRRIHELERQLGVELLERSTHGVILTPAGEQILVHAKKILQACDELFATAREVAVSPGSRRVLHLGICPGVESSTRDRVVAADYRGGRRCRRRRRSGREHAPDQEADRRRTGPRDPAPAADLTRSPQLPARLQAHAGGPGAAPAPGLSRNALAQRPDQPAVRDLIGAQRRARRSITPSYGRSSRRRASTGSSTSAHSTSTRCGSISPAAPASASPSRTTKAHGTTRSSVPWPTSNCASAPGSHGAGKPRTTPPCSGRSAGCATSTGARATTERPVAITKLDGEPGA